MNIGALEIHPELGQQGVVNRSEPRATGYQGFHAVIQNGCRNLRNLQQDEPTGSGA